MYTGDWNASLLRESSYLTSLLIFIYRKLSVDSGINMSTAPVNQHIFALWPLTTYRTRTGIVRIYQFLYVVSKSVTVNKNIVTCISNLAQVPTHRANFTVMWLWILNAAYNIAKKKRHRKNIVPNLVVAGVLCNLHLPASVQFWPGLWPPPSANLGQIFPWSAPSAVCYILSPPPLNSKLGLLSFEFVSDFSRTERSEPDLAQ